MKKIAVILASLSFVVAGCQNVPEEEVLKNYETSMEKFMEEYDAQTTLVAEDAESTDEEKQAKLEELYNDAVKTLVKDGKKLINKYPSGELAVVVLQNVANLMEVDELETVLNKLEGEAAENDYVNNLKQSIQAKSATAEGKMFTDFTITEPDGTVKKLSDYVGKGKYVIVDFWSWWCGPCIREIPNLINVYNEFYPSGKFDMLSVSVWERGEPQKSADKAEELGVCWNEIINGDTIPTDIYGIEGIPHIILFGPDGTILKRDLRGPAIAAELKKYIN